MTTSIQIHNVARLTLLPIRRMAYGNGPESFCVRDIKVTMGGGSTTTLQVFASSEECLQTIDEAVEATINEALEPV